MNTQPLISVIVPCYNVEKYLNKCVDSILKQTYSNFELILVDDGSLDNTSDICDYYGQVDNRVRVLHKVNGGQSDARNSALDIMQGEYVTFVDSDDWIDEDYLGYLYTLMSKYESDIVVASAYRILDGNLLNSNIKENIVKKVSSLYAVENMLYQKEITAGPCAKLFKSSYFATIRFPIGIVFEDLATTYRLYLKAKTIVYSNRCIYSYLYRSDSTEGCSFSEKKYKSAMFVVKQIETDQSLFYAKRAVKSRTFSLLFRIYLSMPYSDKRKQEVWRVLCSKRFDVMIDRNARVKNRMAAFLSYFGEKIVHLVYKRVKTR